MTNENLTNTKALELTRACSRFHLVYDEVAPRDADRIREFCRRERIDFKMAPDRNPLLYRIFIPNVSFQTIERIEEIFALREVSH